MLKQCKQARKCFSESNHDFFCFFLSASIILKFLTEGWIPTATKKWLLKPRQWLMTRLHWIHFYLYFRQLFRGRVRADPPKKGVPLYNHLLPTVWNVCNRVLDQLFGATWNCSGQNDPAGHCISCIGQHFQYNHNEYP